MIKLLSIADIVTLTNVIFGFMAIIMAFLRPNEMRFSFSFILLALLADGLDGVVARRTRKGELGEYFEAMADMTSLGIAPAIFVYVTYNDAVSCCIYRHIILVAVLIVFLSMSVIRLASFHIMKDKNSFVGLPASASTIIILTLAFFGIEFLYVLPVIIIISIVMVTNVRFPKPGLKMDALAAILIILTLILGRNYSDLAPLVLLSMIMIYIIAGPIYLWKTKDKL
jgi:CDP-diacylglycerol--serine O-phosphatidyltransferase